jgi:nucleotide-binding universal stress UspA family protein
MLKLLIPVDASEASRYAIQHAVHRVWTGEALDIHLIHVQPRLSRYVGRFVPLGNRRAFYAERSTNALTAATELLDRAGIRYAAVHVSLGDPAREIVRYAESNRFDGILMASAGMGSASELLLGSVAAKVLRTSRIPVEVVPAAPRTRLRSYAGPAGAVGCLLGLIYAVFD